MFLLSDLFVESETKKVIESETKKVIYFTCYKIKIKQIFFA